MWVGVYVSVGEEEFVERKGPKELYPFIFRNSNCASFREEEQQGEGAQTMVLFELTSVCFFADANQLCIRIVKFLPNNTPLDGNGNPTAPTATATAAAQHQRYAK